MSWAEHYKSVKEQTSKSTPEDRALKEKIFHQYSQAVSQLYNRIKETVKGSGLEIKTKKASVSKELHTTVIGEKEEMESLILSDNDNELQFIPEGISFIGVKGRVGLKSYRKVYAFQSIMEKRLKTFREPFLVLIHDIENENQLVWGYISSNSAGAREIVKLKDDDLIALLNEAFLTQG